MFTWFLTSSGAYDRSAMTRAAWAMARAAIAPPRPIRGYISSRPTLRQAYAGGMRRAWV